MNADFEYLTNGEKRRRARRDLGRELTGGERDKLQLNDIMLGALVVMAAAVSFTDFSLSLGDIRNLTALTLFLYIVTMLVYRNRYARGKRRGMSDEEYKTALADYRAKRNEIYGRSLAGRVPEFCTAYKKRELREYRESLLCDIDLNYEEYKEKYLNMPYKLVMKQPLSYEAKKTIVKCNAAHSVRLYPGMLLNENGEYDREKLVGKSGREREREDRKKQAVTRAVYVIFGATVVIDVILNFSFITVAQWVIRMLPVVTAIINGDDGGYCNITVTETNFKKGQVKVISLFEEYIAEESGTREICQKNQGDF